MTVTSQPVDPVWHEKCMNYMIAISVATFFVTVLGIFELFSSAVECSPKNSSDSSLGHCPMSKSEEFLGEHPLVGEILT